MSASAHPQSFSLIVDYPWKSHWYTDSLHSWSRASRHKRRLTIKFISNKCVNQQTSVWGEKLKNWKIHALFVGSFESSTFIKIQICMVNVGIQIDSDIVVFCVLFTIFLVVSIDAIFTAIADQHLTDELVVSAAEENFLGWKNNLQFRQDIQRVRLDTQRCCNRKCNWHQNQQDWLQKFHLDRLTDFSELTKSRTEPKFFLLQ